VNAVYPLGRYVEDYDYVAGAGDLDQYNGRFTVTPEFPGGTYAYYVTIADDRSPAFPYIINVQLYGASNGGNSPTVAADAVDYFNSGALTQPASADPQLASWYTKGSLQNATAITGYDPSTGASTTWPTNKPANITVSGGNATPATADIQRIRFNTANVYVNSNALPSYPIGPWFNAPDPGGVFMNFASSAKQQFRVTRAPAVASTKSSSGLGAVGIWVNGVSIFNTLDGGSFSNSTGADQGGGGVGPHATHASAASFERGPVAPGSLVSAFAQFNAALATSTATGTPGASEWPLALAGATVTVTDSTGKALPAGIVYASASQLNYRVPPTAAAGLAKVTITAAGTAVTGNITVAATYPGLFRQTADGLAAGQIVRVHNGVQSFEPLGSGAVTLGSDQVYVVLYGTGLEAPTSPPRSAGAARRWLMPGRRARSLDWIR